jgi:hypothetical protein
MTAMSPADNQPRLTSAQLLDAFPRGTILAFFANAGPIPAGWFPCDGSNGTPNLVGKFIIGAANLGEVGQAAGSATVKIDIPVHSHDLVVGHAERALREDGGNGVILHTTLANNLVNGFTAPSTAQTVSFENIPASIKILYIMKG